MSTAFPFTFPRRLALSTGLRLVRWARSADASDARRKRVDAVTQLAREERFRQQRDKEVSRYLTQVRQVL